MQNYKFLKKFNFRSDVSFGEVELPDGQDELFMSTSTHPLTSSSIGESSGSTLVAVSQQSQHDRRDSPHPNSVHSVPYRPHSRTSSSSSPLHPDGSRVGPYFNNIWLQRDPDADTDSLTSGGGFYTAWNNCLQLAWSECLNLRADICVMVEPF